MSTRQKPKTGRVDHGGLDQARQLLKGRTGTPSEYDRPPATPAPGPKRKPLPGQLDLMGNEVPGLPDPEADL